MKKILTILSYILFLLNSNLQAENSDNKLKIGLLAPFSGEYKKLGESIMFSIQMGLREIGDDRIIIIPRDSGSGDAEKLNSAITEIIEEGAKVIIGPINNKDFDKVKKFKDTIFISPSNINPKIENNIISIGISLESQLLSIKKFLKKQKVKKTLILYPKNNYKPLILSKIKELNLSNYKLFEYSSDPKILTGEIEKLTNYKQRKNNLEARKKLLEGKEDENSKKELIKLEQKYTLGKVDFDALVVIDFGSSLKSVLTSLIFSDVNQDDVLFVTVNQWFDKSIFYENSLKNIYYPSVNYKNFERYSKNYYKIFKRQPSEITILTYDAIGLIYYIWSKNKKITSIKDFLIKDKIKGRIGTFGFKDNQVFQDLEIYLVKDNKFIKF
jgi:hypothetical protein